MTGWPSRNDLAPALEAAAHAHHDFQARYLNGIRDENWASWYAAYVLGRLGDFTSPTLLTNLLLDSPGDDDWVAVAAEYIAERGSPDNSRN